jgi:hypothetical protein
MHRRSSRGRGPDTRRKIRRDNAGKVQLPAGIRNNLQRPSVQGEDPRLREDFGLAHELDIAMREG